jgi:hypothetical protein
MSKNINQIFITNPITSNTSTDLMYFGQSPYGPTNDAAMTYANFSAQFLTPSTGVISATGTANQVLVNGTTASPQTGACTFTLPQDIALTSNPTFASVKLTAAVIVKDANGNSLLGQTAAASAVNYVSVNNAASAATPTFQSTGADGDIGLGFLTKGAGVYRFSSAATSNNVILLTGTGLQHTTNLNFANTAASQTASFPDSTGTLCMLNAASHAATNGFIPIGDGTTFTTAALTAGTNINIANASGSVTISTTGSASLTWTTLSGTSQLATANSAFVSGASGQTTITLPASCAVGDIVAVEGLGAGGWILAANTSQTIKIGSGTTSSGGSLTSAAASDNVYVTCIVANTTWRVRTTNSAGLTIA